MKTLPLLALFLLIGCAKPATIDEVTRLRNENAELTKQVESMKDETARAWTRLVQCNEVPLTQKQQIQVERAECLAKHERALMLYCTRETDGHDLDDDIATCIESLYGTGDEELKAMRFGGLSEDCIEALQ